jgi:hypothetical protein
MLDMGVEAHVAGIDVNCPLFLLLLLLPDFNEIVVELYIKFRENRFSGSQVVSFAQRD